MTTPTLDRPRRIPRRDHRTRSAPTDVIRSAGTPVLLDRVAISQVSEPTVVRPCVAHTDPLAGLTRSERQALKRAPKQRRTLAQATRSPIPAVPQVAVEPSAPPINLRPVAPNGPRRTRRGRTLAGDIVFIAIIAVLLWFTWPARLGGASTFVIVHGHSMDGTFRSGDLVLVRRATNYQVGDIAAYHVPKGQPGAGGGVIHRIIRKEGNRYVFQGDNRATADDWRPRASDIMGRLVVRMPMPGEQFWALLPWVWCAAVGGAVMWMFWPRRPLPRELSSPA